MSCRGGTDIFAAVNLAVDECKKRPATMAANHVILVTDGDSGSVDDLDNLIPVMKEKNIVLDFIFIQGTRVGGWGRDVTPYIQKIRDVATQTGGEVIEVNNAEAVIRKLSEVSNRLLLPANATASGTGMFATIPDAKTTKKRSTVRRKK